MPQCSRCHTDNAAGSRYCAGCGHLLDATSTGGRTVIMPPPTVPMPAPVNPVTQTNHTHVMPPCHTSGGMVCMPHRPCLTQAEDTFCVIDISTSMRSACDDRFTKLQAAGRAYGSMMASKTQIDPNDRVGIIAFNSRARLVMPLTVLATGKRDLLRELQALRPSNGTDQNEGLKLAEQSFDWSRQDVVRRIVMLTDGQGGEPVATAERLKANGVVIDVIGVGSEPEAVNEDQLKAVASVINGEQRYTFIQDQQTLVALYTNIANKTATA